MYLVIQYPQMRGRVGYRKHCSSVNNNLHGILSTLFLEIINLGNVYK